MNFVRTGDVKRRSITFITLHNMNNNKLYDAIEPTVIDDELIRTKCIHVDTSLYCTVGDKKGDGVKKEVNNQDFAEVGFLRFSFLSMCICILTTPSSSHHTRAPTPFLLHPLLVFTVP